MLLPLILLKSTVDTILVSGNYRHLKFYNHSGFYLIVHWGEKPQNYKFLGTISVAKCNTFFFQPTSFKFEWVGHKYPIFKYKFILIGSSYLLFNIFCCFYYWYIFFHGKKHSCNQLVFLPVTFKQQRRRKFLSSSTFIVKIISRSMFFKIFCSLSELSTSISFYTNCPELIGYKTINR